MKELIGLSILIIVLSIFIEESSCQLNVTRINKSDLYTYTDGTYFGMFMVTPKGVIAIDAPPTVAGVAGKSIVEIIQDYTSQPVKWVIYSHHHLDHIGSAGQYPKNAEYICSKQTSKYVKARGAAPNCTLIVGDEYQLKVDKDHVVQLNYRGIVHTEGNLYIYVPSEKLLMLVDFVFPQWGPYHSMGMSSSLSKYYEAFPNVMAYDFQWYVGGHVDRIGSRQDVQVGKQLFDDIQTAMQQAFKTVNTTAVIESKGGYNGTNSFTVFRAITDAYTNECVKIVLQDMGWQTKLIDAAAYMDTHCFLMSEHINIDY